ncbi:MAG: DUF992 domain-containing protein [Rhizomicrobium sp.]|jgi:hypothetical protein
MSIFKKTRLIAAAASLGIAALASAAPANAADIKAGVLNCDVSGGWGFVLGSSKDVRCVYTPVRGAPERYVGTISKFGVDIGYTRGGVIVWEVLAPSVSPARGALQGGYAGATASATVGLGGGAHVLVGGLEKSISLQPVSFVGEKGLNFAAGIGAMNLKHVL